MPEGRLQRTRLLYGQFHDADVMEKVAACSELIRVFDMAQQSQSDAVRAFGVLVLSRLRSIQKNGPWWVTADELKAALEDSDTIRADLNES